MKKRIVSALTAVTLIIGAMPMLNVTYAEQEVEETLFDSDTISALHLMDSSYNHNGSSDISNSIGEKFNTEISSTHAVAKYTTSNNGSSKLYPIKNNYYKSNDMKVETAWEYKIKWTPNDKEDEILEAIINDSNTVQIGARFEGYRDTQGGRNAGLPWMKVGQVLTDSSERTSETTMDDDVEKCKYHNLSVDWMSLKSNYNYFILYIGGTTGCTGVGKNRNYASLQNPEIFLRDTTLPKVKSIEVLNNDQGNKDFVCGDTMRVKVIFNEPIRVKDKDYTKAFSMTASGVDNFKPVSYSDETASVIFETTIKDDAHQMIAKGDMSVSLNIDKTQITDLAGNQMSETTKSSKDEVAVVSGLVPRINKIEYVSAKIAKDGNYESTNSLQGKIKAGDLLYFDVYFNQSLKRFEGTTASTFNVKVGSQTCKANLDSVYKSTTCVAEKSEGNEEFAIPTDTEFDRLRFCIKVPEDAQSSDEIYIDASNSDGKWSISDNADLFNSIKGNIILTNKDKMKNIDAVTTIVADGERILPRIYVDAEAPVITLTDASGNAANVYTSSDAAASDSATKANSYTVYFKSDEEVSGSVEASLKYAPKDNLDNITTAATITQGAYTGNEPVSGMYAEFKIPNGIDSKSYDIYIETTAMDFIYNEGTQKFYLAADTKAPTVTIESDSNVEKSNDIQHWWEYDFDVDENAKVYYRFGSEDEFKHVDSGNGYLVNSTVVDKNVSLSATIEYYAEDDMGNKSDTGTSHFYIGDETLTCEPVDEDEVSEYLPSRDIEFTGFKPSSGNVHDYLVYKIITGENTEENTSGYNVIEYTSENEDETLSIPANELSDGCIIKYRRIRTEGECNLNIPTPEFYLIYHCDDFPPDMAKELTENSSGNVAFAKISAPDPNGSHPNNITKMEISIAGKTVDKTVDVTDRYVHNGKVTANISFDDMPDSLKLPSGEYTMDVTLTDANGHTGTYNVFTNESIIIDAPEIKDINIIGQNNADPFAEGVNVYAEGDSVQDEIAVTADAIDALAESGAENIFGGKYSARFNLAMRYEGTTYPKLNESGEIKYTISKDGGATWTAYSSEGIQSTDTAVIQQNDDGESYAVYEVYIPLPENTSGGVESYLIRVRCGANPYVSDTLKVTTVTDTTAPVVSLYEAAVGSDEKGWSEELDYTNDYVKLRMNISDEGFYDGGVTTSVQTVRNTDGNLVDPADYVEIRGGDTNSPEIIVKEACSIVFKTSDVWGNETTTSYECNLIDDIVTGYNIYNENTDVYTYALLTNIKSYVLSAQIKGSTEITDAGQAKFEELIASQIISKQDIASMSGVRNGDINAVYRMYQRQLADAKYDILCGIYDRKGNLQVFKVMTVENETTPIEVSPFTSTVTGMGKTIHAVQKLEFNKPVAQLCDDIVEEIKEGAEITRSDIDMHSMVFSTTLYAVLDETTGGDVYVTDAMGQIEKVSVDVTDTEFVHYDGYAVSYEDVRNGELQIAGSEHVYGSNSEIKITVTGNNGISMMNPVSDFMTVTTEGEGNLKYLEYYDAVVFTADTSSLTGEGTIYAADMKVKNVNGLEDYNDAIVIRYDNTAPYLVDCIEMVRHDSYDPFRVAYIFYDRKGLSSIEENTGSGFNECQFANGIYFAQYTENCTPAVKVTDSTGNVTQIQGPEINDILVSTTLQKGIDYDITVYNDDNEEIAVAPNTYYRCISAEIVPVNGGKSFTVEPQGKVDIQSETPVIFKLTDENGAKTIYRYVPPVDSTPPVITAVQNNSGAMVNDIEYTIIVSDAKSGVSRVYVKGAGENGADLVLSKVSVDGIYSTYSFKTYNADEYTICAEDALGNIAETTVSSNSAVVGELEVVKSQSTTSLTNKSVKVSFSAKDGRRIYTSVKDTDTNNLIPNRDYLISGNEIFFVKNGTLTLICTDEIGNRSEQTVIINNIDKTPPKVTGTVTPLYYGDGTEKSVDPLNASDCVVGARISFSASAPDNVTGKVKLIRLRDNLEELGYTEDEILEYWKEYTANPDQFIGTPEFEKIHQDIFIQDITLPTTYVDVDTNGEKMFFCMDDAGNVATIAVDVNVIDNVAPEFEKVTWNYKYYTGERFETLAKANGEAQVENKTVTVDEKKTGHLTNQSVEIEITSNEDVKIKGDSTSKYSKTVKKTFFSNGIYKFVLEDKANNIREVTAYVENILKDEIYIEPQNSEDILYIKGNSTFNADDITKFKVYKYDGSGAKVYLDADEYTSEIDYGGLNIDDINENEFDRNSPYTIKYTAWDKAGNKVERTKKVTLCDEDDIMVMINGKLPDTSGYIYVEGNSANAEIMNYKSIAAVKLAKGQYNGAQMKTKGTSIAPTDGVYKLNFDTTGWYTLSVRTLYQDIFVVRIYVSNSK